MFRWRIKVKIKFIDEKAQNKELVAMVTKVLRRKEVELGFVQIPVKNRAELLGGMSVPFDTQLNDVPAKVDKQGRLWSGYLKKRFSVNTEVSLSRNVSGFQLTVNGQKQETTTQENERALSDDSISMSISSTENIWYKVLEGDCIKYMNEGAIGNVHLTFFDPPYLQGKDYRFFDDSQSAPKYWKWVRAIVELSIIHI